MILKLKAFIKRRLPTSLKNWLKDSPLNLLRVTYRNFEFRFIAPRVFGQSAEDFLLQRWLPERDGTYIDVGAGEPVRGSNTYVFYKQGWRGILVEPIRLNCQVLKLLRPQDEILQILVGNIDSVVDFYEFEPYQYSTTLKSVAANCLDKSIRLKSVSQIGIVPLSSFAPNMTPDQPTLISIDVEGADLAVLESNDWSRTRPRAICVEEWNHLLSGGVLEAFLTERNYKRVSYTGLSSIYIELTYLQSFEN